jgi:hypothetical protein
MPPFTYTLLHPEARLSEEVRGTLIAALQQVLADDPPVDTTAPVPVDPPLRGGA